MLFRSAGAAAQTHLLQTSTNLVDWETIGVATEVAEGVFEFEDANAMHSATRFYRTMLPVTAEAIDTEGQTEGPP